MQKRPRKGVERSPLPYQDLHYQRYYGLDKANAGYDSDNDDPPRLKSVLNPVAKNELVNVG
ncbi:hypothetical protein H5410_003451 [Solanum commersonii]|uniref:Uncharacterized protein n=1 Tax=Solanum commersonii TaxID=4109 RepID=A0A9J6B4Q4_SOLCO|nr:hypothetical protein H5410_003451 [Solanum commersonii]